MMYFRMKVVTSQNSFERQCNFFCFSATVFNKVNVSCKHLDYSTHLTSQSFDITILLQDETIFRILTTVML